MTGPTPTRPIRTFGVPLALRRGAFLTFAVVLFIATHWPQLQIDGPVPRTDLWLHVGAFATWTLLFGFGEFIGPWRHPATPLRLMACGLVYAGVDEGLQAIPVLGRFATFEDYLANAVGVLLATVTLTVLARALEPARADRA
jgi:VanZ family protein